MAAHFVESGSIPDDFRQKIGSLAPVQEGCALHVLLPDDSESCEAVVEDNGHYSIFVSQNMNAQVFFDMRGTASHCTVELFLERSAVLTVLFLQRSDMPNVQVVQRASLGEESRLTMQNVSIGGTETTQEFLSRLQGDNAVSSVDWAFHVQDAERYSLSARNVFAARNGGGEMLLKGVAEDTATARCDGMIEIAEQGGGTQTYLTEDVLMLDSTAKVDAIPGLEIRTNDVKASHSATISRVSEADLFYFAARGIPEGLARRMYVQGFLADILRNVQNDNWRNVVQGALEAKYVRVR